MKITTLNKLQKIVEKHKTQGKKIGLITGCFDIIHIGHIELFKFAKKHCDIVIIGLENDETIKLSKGEGRPIHNIKQRKRTLSELKSIDYVFPIESTLNFGTDEADFLYFQVAKVISPHYLITSPKADRFWGKKEKRAKEIGAELLRFERKEVPSSTLIIDKLSKEL